jgi:hypothetical protein
MRITDLPDEMISHIASYLPLKDMITFGRTCKKLKAQVIDNEEGFYGRVA